MRQYTRDPFRGFVARTHLLGHFAFHDSMVFSCLSRTHLSLARVNNIVSILNNPLARSLSLSLQTNDWYFVFMYRVVWITDHRLLCSARWKQAFNDSFIALVYESKLSSLVPRVSTVVQSQWTVLYRTNCCTFNFMCSSFFGDSQDVGPQEDPRTPWTPCTAKRLSGAMAIGATFPKMPTREKLF
jgi:hypothetical protein